MRVRAAQFDSGEAPPPRRRRRRGLFVAAIVVVVLAGGGAYVERTNPHGISFAHPLGVQRHRTAGARDNHPATSTAAVTRRSSLSETTPVNGTLGYAGGYTVLGQLHGTVTDVPKVGQVIRQGQVLYRVDDKPVVLLYGSTPAYRTLAEGATAADVTGHDVKQLNQSLVALRYVTRSELDPNSDEFSWATNLGVQRLQDALGVTATGQLALGDYVFLPAAARVTAVSAKLGGPADGPLLTATSTARQVTVNLDADQQSEIKAGDHVAITLPNDRTTPGVVSSVGAVATTASGSNTSSSPTITVQISPTDPHATGSLDQASVQVTITTATVHNVLAVPVTALLALAGGGYAVEVVTTDGTHQLVSVAAGLFDDAAGLVQVTGSGLAAGQRVVVPAS
jgi:hypothetical protein